MVRWPFSRIPSEFGWFRKSIEYYIMYSSNTTPMTKFCFAANSVACVFFKRLPANTQCVYFTLTNLLFSQFGCLRWCGHGGEVGPYEKLPTDHTYFQDIVIILLWDISLSLLNLHSVESDLNYLKCQGVFDTFLLKKKCSLSVVRIC